MVEKFCPECGCKRPIETKVISEEFIVRGEPISVSGEVNVCAECNSPFGDKLYDDLMQKAYGEYRTRHGMMSAQEIKAVREQYGLTQALFAKILKIGEATLQRYERGSLPSLSLHALLLRARETETFIGLVEKSKGDLTPEEYRSAMDAVSLPQDSLSGMWNNYISRLSEANSSGVSGAELIDEVARTKLTARFEQAEIARGLSRPFTYVREGQKDTLCSHGEAFSSDFKEAIPNPEEVGEESTYALAA